MRNVWHCLMGVLVLLETGVLAGVDRLRPAPDQVRPESKSDAAARFLNPPAESRMLRIIHSWPDETPARDALIRSLTEQGFGGVVCNVSFAEYLESETKWKAFARAVTEARQAGLALWLYDEKGYPSGAAGGLVLRDHPEWEARGLLIADSVVDGGAVTLQIPPGTPFLTAAFPVREGNIQIKEVKDLSDQVRDGRLSWQAPAGRWHVMAITQSRLFEGTHASLSLAEHIAYPNLLQSEPTGRFLEVTHQRYAQHLGDDLGQWFAATFTDEPSLMSLFLRPMPYRVLPWSPNLPVEFKRRRGYPLEAVVPALVADAGPSGQRARFDYWQTVGELVSENYFGQIQEWCGRHHLLSGGHLLMEENLVNHVPLYGDFFRCLRRLDAPSIDCLTSIPGQVPWFIARLASSAAELENKSLTMCETSDHSQRYRPPGDPRPVRTVTEAEIRGTCNRLVVSGIDTITSYYSFADLSNEQLRRLNAWIGRCCASLKGGHQVADVAVLYPVESLWPRFTPSRHYANDSASAAQIESLFHDVSQTLFGATRDFTYVDGRALAAARVEEGALVHGNLRWRVVILPGADTLPLAAWENLSHFVQSGGVVFALGALPANSETDFPSPRVQALASGIFGSGTNPPRVAGNLAGGGGIFLPAGLTGLLPVMLDRILEPDVKVLGPASPLRATHRHIGAQEVYFVVNDSDQPWKGGISLCVAGTGEQCDPATGQVTPLAAGNEIALNLEAFGGIIFRFSAARLPQRSGLKDDMLPRLTLRVLPGVSPSIARGEFVREELADASGLEVREPAWRITGTLTKGQVDTFLFARFAYPQKLDLRDADSLVLDTWVPDGQRTPTQLLLILHEQDGADYFASTGRLLGSPGRTQTSIPLSRLQLAGWSTDQNNHLDLAGITEVRIGWGGYYGTAGEQVQFTLSLPRMATSR